MNSSPSESHPPCLNNLTQNEVKALRSIFDYFREVDEDASPSVICLAIIHALARSQKERSCLLRAVDFVSENPMKASFLSIIDHGRALFKGEVGANCDDELPSQQYHFLCLVHSYHQKCSKEGRYLLAQEFMDHEQRIRKDVETQQIDVIKRKHISDRHRLVVAHDRQVVAFQHSWDEFMKEFERKSQAHIDELSHTHQQQLSSLKQSIEESANMTQMKWSKDVIEHRKRFSLMADQQRYQEAHRTKLQSDALEEKERSDHHSITNSAILRKESNMTQKHQAEMSVLLKRIESKRREFQKLREDETSRLVQRNKNIQASFDSKHVTECANLASAIEQHVKKLFWINDN